MCDVRGHFYFFGELSFSGKYVFPSVVFPIEQQNQPNFKRLVFSLSLESIIVEQI